MKRPSRLVLAALIIGLAGEAASAQVPYATYSVFTFGKPGSLTIDASGTAIAFPAPNKPRSFATWNDVVAFAEKYLNGTPLYDKTGALIGVQGTVTMLGTAFVKDTKGIYEPVIDAIDFYVQGLFGYFYVGGQPQVLGGAPVNIPNSGTLSEEINQCDASNQVCANYSSWNDHYIIYNSVGSRTGQTRGGYQEHLYFCNPPPDQSCPPGAAEGYTTLGYSCLCVYATGTNMLSVADAWWQFPNNPQIIDVHSVMRRNVTAVNNSHWSIVFNANASDAIGVCGYHSASGTPNGRTGAGTYILPQCP